MAFKSCPLISETHLVPPDSFQSSQLLPHHWYHLFLWWHGTAAALCQTPRATDHPFGWADEAWGTVYLSSPELSPCSGRASLEQGCDLLHKSKWWFAHPSSTCAGVNPPMTKKGFRGWVFDLALDLINCWNSRRHIKQYDTRIVARLNAD